MAFLLIGFAAVALIDLPPLIRLRSWRGIAVFCVLFLSALTLSVLQVMGIEVPSVMLLLGKLVRAIGLGY